MNATSCTSPPAVGSDAVSASEIDASCRAPLFVLFVSAAFWLVVASGFGLIASIKFHSADFLSGSAWLTYGRVYAVAKHALLYGFAVQAGLGVALWIIAHLGGTRVLQPWFIAIGGKLWNLGVLLGALAILCGDNTGFENLEMPRHAALFMFLGYLLIGLWAALTLHGRRERPLQPSQWFLVAALLWFPWIFSTAHLLLTLWPVRGVMQAVIGWWYSANLTLVWFGLVGLAAIFHFVPRLMNRPLHSRYLALFTFWTLILCATWGGIPASAPVPAWMPALSTVASVLTVLTVLSVMLNVYRTVGRGCSQTENPPPGKFFAFGVMAFVIAWLMNAVASVPPISWVTNFTWFTTAQSQLNVYGFFAMTMFGALYYVTPRVMGIEWPFPKFVRAHFWLAAIGIVLIVLPLAIGGVLQGIRLNDPKIDFVELTRATLHFLRLATVGELALLLGHLLLAANLAALSVRYWRTHLAPICAAATAELKPAEVKA